MESWHVVGQKVTLINRRPFWRRKRYFVFSWWYKPSLVPVFGKVYTISKVIYLNGKDNTGEYEGIAFVFEELPANLAHSANAFLPVQATSIECFRSLLSPTPEQKRQVLEEMIDEAAL